MASTSGIELFATDSADRVRAHTPAAVQEQLDQDLVDRVRHFAQQTPDGSEAAQAMLTRRVEELEQETDIERTLAANAAVSR